MEAIAKLVQDDPYLKQSAQERIADRRGRRANIAAKATPDTAIEVRRAEAAPRYIPPPKEVLCAKPVADAAWIERQLALHPPLKKPWFYIEDQLCPGQKPGPLIADIQIAVLAEYPLLTMNDLNSARRTVGPVRARQVAMYLAKILTTKSLPEIGRRMGGRDHTTILYGFRKIARLILTDPELAAEVERIKGSLEAAA